MDNIQDLSSKIDDLTKQVDSLISDKDMNIDRMLKKYRSYIITTGLVFVWLLMTRPKFVKTKKIVKDKIDFIVDPSKFILWNLILSGIGCSIVYQIEKRNSF